MNKYKVQLMIGATLSIEGVEADSYQWGETSVDFFHSGKICPVVSFRSVWVASVRLVPQE